jgi:predicted outer membrane repeat protein
MPQLLKSARVACCALLIALSSIGIATRKSHAAGGAILTYPNIGSAGDCPAGSLQACIDAAATGDIIQIRPGTYTEGVSIINKSIALVGLDGGAQLNAPSGQRVIFAESATTTERLTLVNLTLTGGTADSGGALRVGRNMPTSLVNMTVTNSSATIAGGGIYAESSLSMRGSSVTNNSARQDGGGIASTDVISASQSVIANNTAGFGGGGAFARAVALADTTIENNTAQRLGGGLFANDAALQRVIVRANRLPTNGATRGGGVRVDGTTSIEQSQFVDNTASDGGGVYANAALTISATTFLSNTASNSGGAIYANGAVGFGNAVRVRQSAFVGNRANFSGGALTFVDGRDVAIERTRILRNDAYTGAGIQLEATVARIDNTILGANTSRDGASGVNIGGAFASDLSGFHNTFAAANTSSGSALRAGDGRADALNLTNSIVAGYAVGVRIGPDIAGAQMNGVLWAGNITDSIGALAMTNAISGEANFVDPAASNYNVQAGAPAVNAGVASGIAVDIDGDPRPIASAPDLGADEVNARPIADAGADQSVRVGAVVTLSAEASSDPDGLVPLRYLWSRLDGGPAAALSALSTVTTTFSAPNGPTPFRMMFGLIVTDSLGVGSLQDVVTVTVTNLAPVASAGADQVVPGLSTVSLSGSGSDPDGHALTYRWTQTGGPSVALSASNLLTPTFTAPNVNTTLIFTLIATDAYGLQSEADTVAITVLALTPTETPRPGIAQKKLWLPITSVRR